MTIEVVYDCERGCGWRKGGLYLVSGELSEPCPKLPILLDVCPTCGEGIRPARGWTWVDGEAIAEPARHGSMDHNARCPLGVVDHPVNVDGIETEYGRGPVSNADLSRSGLIWVGEKFYKTAEFTKEAIRLGVSRRITAIPRGFELGKTWVLLAHRRGALNGAYDHDYTPPEEKAEEGGGCDYGNRHAPVCESSDGGAFCTCGLTVDATRCRLAEDASAHREELPAIFTLFRPTRIEYVVKGDETEEQIAALEKRGVTCVKVVGLVGDETSDAPEPSDDDGGQAEAAERLFLDGEGTLMGVRWPLPQA